MTNITICGVRIDVLFNEYIYIKILNIMYITMYKNIKIIQYVYIYYSIVTLHNIYYLHCIMYIVYFVLVFEMNPN